MKRSASGELEEIARILCLRRAWCELGLWSDFHAFASPKSLQCCHRRRWRPDSLLARIKSWSAGCLNDLKTIECSCLFSSPKAGRFLGDPHSLAMTHLDEKIRGIQPLHGPLVSTIPSESQDPTVSKSDRVSLMLYENP